MAGSAHGHTPAAWTGVTITFIGFCVAGVFMVAANPLGFWAGIGIVCLGGIVGAAMSAAGLGLPQGAEDQASTGVSGQATGQPVSAQTSA